MYMYLVTNGHVVLGKKVFIKLTDEYDDDAYYRRQVMRKYHLVLRFWATYMYNFPHIVILRKHFLFVGNYIEGRLKTSLSGPLLRCFCKVRSADSRKAFISLAGI